ncbi:enoyl-CoA hydratase-related protein [Saccharomonospora sp. NPDC046836]|uniref:enoyl-CoA hydratase-related protein n=1 Tax=Saccharomonospora sp. NPDC046836 TaxID=3156921 RepID=UPI0033E3D8A3
MSLAELQVTRTDDIETWVVHDPPTRNAITSPSMIDSIVREVGRINGDQTVRCVIVTGAGGAFSSGGNVHDMVARRGMFSGGPYEQFQGYANGIHRVARAVSTCEVPLVAAVNGPAVGAGCDLALLCDLRIASTNAFFAENFVQLGLISGDGGAWLLTRLVGPARAAEMTLTGDRVDAATALEWGLVNAVSEPADLLREANALARRVAKNPSSSARLAKALLRRSADLSFDSVLELSGTMQALAHHTEAHRNATRAFADRSVNKASDVS